jgi:hypothetical protein
VHRALQDVIEGGTLVRIVTGLDIFEGVALTDVHIERERPGHLRFTATAKVLRIVSSETVDLPTPAAVRSLPATSRGKQPTVDPSAAEEASVARASILAGAAGLGGT